MLGGSVAQQPKLAGHTWAFLQYLLGFRALGFDVLFLDRLTGQIDQGVGAQYLRKVMERFGLDDRYCLLGADRTVLAGLDRADALERTRDSLGLINVNGFIDDQEFLAAAPRRVYLDIDPGFAQMWRELGLHDSFAGHDVFVTVAEKIGRPGCRIPTCGLDWVTTRPPVVLDLWHKVTEPGEAFTTIGSWRGPFDAIDFEGTSFGLRAHEFRKFFELPELTGERFEVALDIDRADLSDLAQLERHGWRLRNPQVAAGSPDEYQAFIRASKAELMVAKNMYVETRGGWFSDRSACYLASGRPVIAEDTGLAGLYPLGEGLVPFHTLDDAAAGVEAVSTNYSQHARAAREIAESELGSDRVLESLVERALR